MSVIVKGMDMPKNCLECIFKDIGMSMMTRCFLQKEWVKYKNDSHIPQQCPLIEIPKGAILIDKRIVKEKMIPLDFSVQKWISEVDLDLYVPTVFEEEE